MDVLQIGDLTRTLAPFIESWLVRLMRDEAMNRAARALFSGGTVLLLAANFAACNSTPETVNTNDPISKGGGGQGGALALEAGSDGLLAGARNGSGGLQVGMGAMTGVGGVEDKCVAHVSSATIVPLDVYMMIDVSTSMLDPTSAAVSKWAAVKSAIETFVKDGASAGMGVGLQYFPILKPNAPASCASDAACGDSGPCFLKFCWPYASDFPCEADADCGGKAGSCVPRAYCANNPELRCQPAGSSCGKDAAGHDLGKCTTPPGSCEHTATCDVTTYATPDEPIRILPDGSSDIAASLEAKTPNGQTPTGPALAGAIQQASTWGKAHPDRQAVAIMATDGLPTECSQIAIDQVASIAKKGLAATPSIETFVIGVFGSQDIAAQAPGNLDTIAQGGGTKTAFIVDTTMDVTAQFLAALDAIRAAKLDCTFQVPLPGLGETLDYHQVNVQVSNGGQDTDLFYVPDAAHCDAGGGWYYDTDPDQSSPSKIIVCPSSCSAFQQQKASVNIALGCQTVVK